MRPYGICLATLSTKKERICPSWKLEATNACHDFETGGNCLRKSSKLMGRVVFFAPFVRERPALEVWGDEPVAAELCKEGVALGKPVGAVEECENTERGTYR